MNKLLKELLLSKIEAYDKTVGSVSSYSLNRRANGTFQIIIFWSGQRKKGDPAPLNIELDNLSDTAKLAIDVFEEILKEANSVSLETKLRKQIEDNTKKKEASTFFKTK